MEQKKEENGSPEPVIKIRASLNKVIDDENELVIFFAKKRKTRVKGIAEKIIRKPEDINHQVLKKLE